MSRAPGQESIVPLDLDALRSALADSGEPFEPLGMSGLIVGSGALGRLGDVIGTMLDGTRTGARDVAVLAAATPMTVRGSALREAVERQIPPGCGQEWIVLGPPDGALHADERTVATARQACAEARCVVTVGSGTVTDIGASVTHLDAIAFSVVPEPSVLALFAGGLAAFFAARRRQG